MQAVRRRMFGPFVLLCINASVLISALSTLDSAPPLPLGLVMGRAIPLWSYLVSFAAAMAGSAACYLQDAPAVIAAFGDGHKFARLPAICASVLLVGFAACIAGIAATRKTGRGVAAAGGR